MTDASPMPTHINPTGRAAQLACELAAAVQEELPSGISHVALLAAALLHTRNGFIHHAGSAKECDLFQSIAALAAAECKAQAQNALKISGLPDAALGFALGQVAAHFTSHFAEHLTRRPGDPASEPALRPRKEAS